MKKLHCILAGTLAMVFTGSSLFAQKTGSSFEEGTTTVNIGVGVGRSSFGNYGYYGAGYYGYGNGFGTKLAVERGMWQLGPGVLSLGAEIGASFSSARVSGIKSNIVIAAVRSAYHFGWGVENLDTYAGLSVGPGFRSYDYYSSATATDKKHDVIIAPGAFVGGTYYFSPNIGVNVEAGYDITVIQGGIIFKLN
jgi:hypothetical protein